jgi:hypothetical protein
MIRKINQDGTESDVDSQHTITAKCGDEIKPGDVIFYWQSIFCPHTSEAERLCKVLEVDPDNKEKPLLLENRWDVLPPDYEIKRVKQYKNGILQDIPDSPWREIREFLLRKGRLAGASRKSLLAQKLEKLQKRFSDNYVEMAEEEGYPVDLVRNIYKTNSTARDEVSEYETDSDSDSSKDHSGSTIEEHEYMKLYSEKAECRRELEKKAAAGQKKQADDVNKGRKWDGGEHIPKDSMCILTLTKNKAKLGIKDLPVQIVKLIYYKQSESIRYQLCCKDGILKGTFGR